VARRNLVRKLLTAGRFEEGLEELEKSTGELARASGVRPDEHASHHYYHGEMMIKMRRWTRAREYLEQARSLYAQADEISDFWLQSTSAMLVWAMCQQGDSDATMTRFEALESTLESELSMGGSSEARIRSARACVHWRSGNLERALHEIDQALTLVSDAGAVLERAERMVLRARILASMGEASAGLAQAGAAVRLFADLGLADHPNASELRRIEREL
jgi:tetratricopeptide (TPR) repeat protein